MGRYKLIASPEEMWQHFIAYKEWVKANPIKVTDWVGGQAKEVTREKERPLTMEGFDNYLFENNIIESIDHYFSNREGRYSDFIGICTRIRKYIREEQIAGGMAGIYNPSITQRLNGLVEKVQEDGKKELTIKVKYGSRNNTARPARESDEDDVGGEKV